MRSLRDEKTTGLVALSEEMEGLTLGMTLVIGARFYAFLAAVGAVTCGCRSPRDLIQPTISAPAARAIAMKTAPLIVVAEIQGTSVYDQPREVEKPDGVGGPMVPRIPLYLAKMSAKILLPMRGKEGGRITFYSWVWASGKHGGPRLFHPGQGSVHILFLKTDSGYLHTVCDYPNCDLEISSRWSTGFLDYWRTGYEQNLELPERIVAVRLKAEWESSKTDSSEYWRDCYDLVEFTSPPFVVGQLNSLCNGLKNPLGRRLACSAYAEQSKNFW